MKKLYSLFLFLLPVLLLAAPVSEPTARLVASNFYRNQNGFAAQQVILREHYLTSLTQRPVYYIYQMDANNGYVIVSGDDQAFPIIGYALKGKYVTQNQPEHFVKWILKYREELIYIIENNIPATPEIAGAWTKLLENQPLNPLTLHNRPVNPLLQLGWDQGQFYNALCPFSTQYNARTVTGCVATAMAMMLKYWNYPAQGTGYHSYNTQQYGTLSANFANTTYNYANMPNQLTSANNDVATLMYHCGVAVEMNYGVAQTGGSMAYVCIPGSPQGTPNSELAYETYFGFDPTLKGEMRQNFTDANWIALLKSDLDAQRIIQYAGIGSGGGHTWICDGYDNNNMFHMNWGWSNNNDGYFNLNALNPGTLGVGGGSGGFNSTQQAIIGVKPITGGGGGQVQPGNLTLQSAMSVSPNPISFGESFTVTANIKNNTSSIFQGDIAAALFTADNFLVDIIYAYTNTSIPANGTTGSLLFYTPGMLATPGTYQISLFYRPTGGNWTAVGSSTFNNPISLTINSLFNYMILTQAITYTPANPVTGQSFSVTTNIGNNGFFTYFGTYYAALYDLQGNYVTTIGQLNETQGLPVGFQYNAPFLTFQTNNLNVQPGSYILAILEQQQGYPIYFVGGGPGNFNNPIVIKVAAPPPPPDQYEVNDIPQQAALLPVNFSGNNATVSTSNANIHVGSDYDFYFINLAQGFNYNLSASVQDGGNSTNFTVDVVFAFNAGQGLSDAYDSQTPGSVTLPGGSQVLFAVAPMFTGSLGTYQLNIQLQRNAITSVNDATGSIQDLRIYPNPANESVIIDLPEGHTGVWITDLTGRSVLTDAFTGTSGKAILDISHWSKGIYFIKTQTEKQQFSGKLIKQ